MNHAPRDFSKVDVQQIKSRIKLSSVIGQSVELKRAGQQWQGLCPFHNEATPSFNVHDEKGFYYCFGCDARGDIFNWIMRTRGLDFKDALTEIQRSAGQFQAMPPRARHEPQPAREQENLREYVEKIWAIGRPIGNTAVALYLQGRGVRMEKIGAGAFSTLRYHPALAHKETSQTLPAMIARIERGDSATLIGLHRTYLESVSAGGKIATRKARVVPNKKMLGQHVGGAVRFAPAAETIVIAEGIETALSVMQALQLPTWAALSLSNLGQVELPATVNTVVLAADADAKDARNAEAQLQRAATQYAAGGREVKIMRPPKGLDFNDLLQKGGADGRLGMAVA